MRAGISFRLVYYLFSSTKPLIVVFLSYLFVIEQIINPFGIFRGAASGGHDRDDIQAEVVMVEVESLPESFSIDYGNSSYDITMVKIGWSYNGINLLDEKGGRRGFRFAELKVVEPDFIRPSWFGLIMDEFKKKIVEEEDSEEEDDGELSLTPNELTWLTQHGCGSGIDIGGSCINSHVGSEVVVGSLQDQMAFIMSGPISSPHDYHDLVTNKLSRVGSSLDPNHEESSPIVSSDLQGQVMGSSSLTALNGEWYGFSGGPSTFTSPFTIVEEVEALRSSISLNMRLTAAMFKISMHIGKISQICVDFGI